MPAAKISRHRGATISVVAFAENLFMPDGPVPGFTRRLTNSVKRSVAFAAPDNKRPRWAHYGPALKQSFVATSRVYPSTSRATSVIGSRKDYAVFVDQGTGIYGGNGPYLAKILPPWTHGGPTLYEATWKPPRGKPNFPVEIKGQKGQHFFDDGLTAGMRAVGITSVTVPGIKGGEGVGTQSMVNGLLGMAPTSPAFIAQLEQWREWRDNAWQGRYEALQRASADQAEAEHRATLVAKARAARTKKVRGLESAAKARRDRETVEVYARQKRVAEAKERREAQERKQRDERLRRNAYEKARRDAYTYLRKIQEAYPNAEVVVAKSRGIARVQWTDSTGQKHHTDFS